MSREPVQGPEPERYGFWEYDIFPGLLSGRGIKGPFANGRCHIEGYDYSLLCIAIVPGTPGSELHARLVDTRKAYEQATPVMSQAWGALRERLVTEVKRAAGG